MATCKTEMNPEDYQNPNAVKVVTDQNATPCIFPGADPLSPERGTGSEGVEAHRHLCLPPGFPAEVRGAAAHSLERVEGLEQLRALENGVKIKVLATDFQAWASIPRPTWTGPMKSLPNWTRKERSNPWKSSRSDPTRLGRVILFSSWQAPVCWKATNGAWPSAAGPRHLRQAGAALCVQSLL